VSDDDLRLLPPGEPRGVPLAIDFEGSTVRAFEGETVAAALFAAGVATLARSPKYHRPRGPFCFEGHCGSCALRIDGKPSVRACMTPVRPGLRCERQNAFPSVEVDLLEAADWMFPRGMDHHTLLTGNRVANRILLSVVRQMGGSGVLPDAPAASIPRIADEEVDACIVGGGPAGLAAAAVLAEALPRARVVLVDEQPRLGGSWHAEPGGARHARAAAARAAAAGARLREAATAIAYYPEDGARSGPDEPRRAERAARDDVTGVLAVATAAGLVRISARRILYATGGYDQNVPFLDNDRPGVLSARACGRLAFRDGIRPGRNLAVVGEAPYGDRLASALAAAGVAATRIDPARELPVAVRGSGRGRALIVADRRGRERAVAADVVAVAATPAPASELARQHGVAVHLDLGRGGFAVPVDGASRTSAPGVYACGDVTGYVGAEAAAAAGAAAGAALARTL
jgi:sarcosine oxidase subunit alpha